MAGEPRGGQYMNVNWIGPTLMLFGSEQQQQRYIPPMAQGKTIWCQGFSEPEAGSDLASDRKSVVSGKSVSVRVDIGGRRIIKKTNKYTQRQCNDQIL